MDHKEKCKKYYANNKGYICYFCKVRCTRDGLHNRSLEHLENMSKGLNIPIELIIPKGFNLHSNNQLVNNINNNINN